MAFRWELTLPVPGAGRNCREESLYAILSARAHGPSQGVLTLDRLAAKAVVKVTDPLLKEWGLHLDLAFRLLLRYARCECLAVGAQNVSAIRRDVAPLSGFLFCFSCFFIVGCYRLEGIDFFRSAALICFWLFAVVSFLNRPSSTPISKSLLFERIGRLVLGATITLAHVFFCIFLPENHWPTVAWWAATLISLLACFYLSFFRLLPHWK